MATITITAVATGFTPPSKVLTMTDQVMTDMIAAYQADADAAIGAPSTAAQVLNFITLGWRDEIKAKIQRNKSVPMVIPAAPTIT